MDPDAAQEEASARAANIFQGYDMLHAILERHEAAIQRRWLKKGREQRRKIVVAAWGQKVEVSVSLVRKLSTDLTT